MVGMLNTKPLITLERKGDFNDPYVSITDTLKVNIDGKVILRELPDKFYKVIVSGGGINNWSEVKEGIPADNEFIVDYNGNKIVTFNLSNVGKQLSFTYKGRGLTYVPTSMIYTEENNGVITETLKDLVDAVKFAAGGNIYVHPTYHSPSIIAQDENNRFVTDTQKSTWDSKETTTGAQAKANAAETNAKNASIPLSQKGIPSGVAKLDSSGNVLDGNGKIITSSVPSEKWGAKGDGVSDDTYHLQTAIDNKGGFELESGKTYKITSTLISVGKDINIVGNGAKIISTVPGIAMSFNGALALSGKTLTSDYKSGTNYLVLYDSSGIKKGMTFTIQSNESYNSERSYWIRGGNAVVTNVVGNTIYFSHPFPAGFASNSVTLFEFYNPVKVVLKDFTVEGINSLNTTSRSTDGIHISHTLSPVISGVVSDNHVNCIHVERSVYPSIIGCTIARSYWYNSESDKTGTSYGILNNSCSGMLIQQCAIQSGRHGYASGGKEPCIQTRISQSSIFNEMDFSSNSADALDAHGNNFDMVCDQVQTSTINVNGNCSFNNCTFTADNSLGSTSISNIYPAETYGRASFVFNNCIFTGDHRIAVVGYWQQATPTRKYIDRIAINNCQNDTHLAVWCNLESTTTANPIKAEIKRIIATNSDNMTFNILDNINYIYIKDVAARISDQASFTQASGKINEMEFRRFSFANRYNSISANNFDVFNLNNCSPVTVGSINSSSNILLGSTSGKLIIENCNWESLQGTGVSMGAVSVLNYINSSVKWSQSNFYTFFTSIKGDVVKGGDGKMYRISSSSGTPTTPILAVVAQSGG